MSHHSHDKPLTQQAAEILRKFKDGKNAREADLERKQRIFAEQKKQLDQALGPTGEFPNGKIVPHDEGGLMFGVTVFNGCVVLDFGKPIRSIGFTRNDALELARVLKQRAKLCPPIIGGIKGEEP